MTDTKFWRKNLSISMSLGFYNNFKTSFLALIWFKVDRLGFYHLPFFRTERPWNACNIKIKRRAILSKRFDSSFRLKLYSAFVFPTHTEWNGIQKLIIKIFLRGKMRFSNQLCKKQSPHPKNYARGAVLQGFIMVWFVIVGKCFYSTYGGQCAFVRKCWLLCCLNAKLWI